MRRGIARREYENIRFRSVRNLSERNSVGALDRLIFRINYAVCKLILRDDGRRLLPIEISQSRPRNRIPLFDFLKGNERLALTISENRGGQEKKKNKRKRRLRRCDGGGGEGGEWNLSTNALSTAVSRKLIFELPRNDREWRGRRKEKRRRERSRRSITTATITTSAITIAITPPTINGPRTARAGSISVSACNLPRRMLMDRTPSPPLALHLENSSTCPTSSSTSGQKPRRPARKLGGKVGKKEKGNRGKDA